VISTETPCLIQAMELDLAGAYLPSITRAVGAAVSPFSASRYIKEAINCVLWGSIP